MLQPLIIVCGLVLVSSLTVWAGPALVIDRSQVRVRADATVQSERLEVLGQGVVVEMLGRKDEWFNVRIPGGREGWVHSNLVQERLVVTGNGVRFRESDSSSSRALGITTRNEEVGKIRQQGNWCEVELETGATGWMSHNYLRPLEVSLGPGATAALAEDRGLRDDEAPAEDVDPASEPEDAPEAEERLEKVPNHYANGLEYESDGDYAAALESFEKVLEAAPEKISARRHAALAHRQLGNPDAALVHLYEALRQTGGRRDLYLHVADTYQLKDVPDSTSKYKALYRGEDPAMAVAATAGKAVVDPEMSEIETDPRWIIYAAGVGGSVILGLLVLIFFRRRKGGSDIQSAKAVAKDKGGVAEAQKRGRGKFGRDLQESSSRRESGSVSSAEEENLDKQIEQKWRELRDGAELFDAVSQGGGTEDGQLEQIVNHLETLRNGLEMQDGRAQIYADIVRL